MAAGASIRAGKGIRRLIAGLLVAAVMVVVLVAVLSRGRSVERSRLLGARLELVAGEVKVTEAGRSSQALSGTPLGVGASVMTAAGSRAFIRTAQGAGLLMRGDSEVVLADRTVELSRGEIWVDAPRSDRDPVVVKAGAHVVTASDGGLSVRREVDELRVYVARGLATLNSPGGRVEVNAGEQATAKGTQAPVVSAVAFWDDWTGGLGDTRAARNVAGSGTGRIYGVDPMAAPGAPAQQLGIAKQSVHAVLRDGVAETEVDQTFSNPGGRPIEGWYWFTLPTDATVTSFALETDGVLVEGEVVEKKEAAAKYVAAMRTGNDPALLEWVDGRSYRARIFPVPANGVRRVVLRYLQIIPRVEGKMRYVYPLRSEDGTRIDELSLSVDLGSEASDYQVATSLDALVEDGGKRVTMRRSGYVPQADFQLELVGKKALPPLRAWRFEAGNDQADYVMARMVPAVDFSTVGPVRADVVLVVDTSAGGDEGARALRSAAAETILRALAPQDRFALVALDVGAQVLHPASGLVPAQDAEIAKALERLSEHPASGATDLGAMFETALARLHGSEQPAIVYVGDGVPTSGEWTAEGLGERLRRSLAGSRARLYCVGVGSDARHALMDSLSQAGGGRYLRIDQPEEATSKALMLTSLIKTPTITDLELDLGAGLDQPFDSASGRLSRGEEMILLARTHQRLPKTATVKGRLAGKDFKAEYAIEMQKGVTTSLVPRLWAGAFVRSLLGQGAEEHRAKVLELGLEYGLLTPYSSILALESEAAYSRMGVRRRASPLRGVRLTSIESAWQEAAMVAALEPSGARVLAGCSKADAPSSEAQSDNKVGGTGTRAKGEEGSVSRLAAEAPAAAPSPVTAVASDIAEAKDDREAKAGDLPAAPPDPMQATAGFVGGHGKMAAGGGGAAMIPPAAAAPVSKTVDEVGAKPGKVAGNRDGKFAVPPGADKAKTVKEPAREPTKIVAPTPVPPRPAPPPTIPRMTLGRCSDAASRPLAERLVLWDKRLKQAAGGADLVRQYELARAACELPDWKDQAALLDLVQRKVDTEQSAEMVLAHFAGEPEAQRFVAQRILRRTVDPRLAAAVSRVLFGGRVDWDAVDRDLLVVTKADDRLDKIRKALLVAPGDPSGEARLVRALAQAGQVQEALSYGRRLRDRGFLTPLLAEQLGDVLAVAGEKEESLRTYSEVVEFDPSSPRSRRMLGDAYLRHGWYQAAYRQYKTLGDVEPKNPVNWLRLAASAAGAGRVDEALRIEREVASGQGSPGPNDPRLWARLWSATRLGMLLAEPPAGGQAERESVVRKLKELQLFSGPGTLALLAWEDLDANFALVSEAGKTGAKEKMSGEVTDAGSTGLHALLLSSEAWKAGSWAVQWRSDPRGRSVPVRLLVIGWNGKSFEVTVRRVEMKPEPGAVAI